MLIYYHKLEATIPDMTRDCLEELTYILNLPLSLYQDYLTHSGTRVLSYVAETTKKETVRIAVPAQSKYSTIKLQGGFFDNYRDFPVHEFWQFVKNRHGRVKVADISFEDTERLLDFTEIRRCCSLDNYNDWLKGQCLSRRKKTKSDIPDGKNRGGIPDLHSNHDLIHLGDLDAVLPAKIYVMPSTGNIKFEVTCNNYEHNHALLEHYKPESIATWEYSAKALLVRCVDFVTPSSKKAKRGVVQLEWWQRFLKDNIKPIRWTDYEPEKPVIETSFETALNRVIGQLQNVGKRFGIADAVADATATVRQQYMQAFEVLHSDDGFWDMEPLFAA
jgi:hypothetical protein